jgi:hypothetical protein
MTQSDQQQFDDPAFKAAVRRALDGGERAPSALRQRITELMVAGAGQEASSDRSPRPARTGSWGWLGPRPVMTLVAACVALVAVGVMFYQVKTNFFPSNSTAKIVKPELPQTFAMEMIETHTNCAKLPDHHLVAGDDFAKLRETLAAQVKVPVAALELKGWTFKGAGVCQVGSISAAHLMYCNAHGQTVSVFSLPADAVYAAPEGMMYSMMTDGHPLSGFKQGKGLYCVVGPAGPDSISLTEVDHLRDMLHAVLPPVSCGEEAQTPAMGRT